jgi:hypothetical protein
MFVHYPPYSISKGETVQTHLPKEYKSSRKKTDLGISNYEFLKLNNMIDLIQNDDEGKPNEIPSPTACCQEQRDKDLSGTNLNC